MTTTMLEEEDFDRQIAQAAEYARREYQALEAVKLRTAFATRKERWIYQQVAAKAGGWLIAWL